MNRDCRSTRIPILQYLYADANTERKVTARTALWQSQGGHSQQKQLNEEVRNPPRSASFDSAPTLNDVSMSIDHGNTRITIIVEETCSRHDDYTTPHQHVVRQSHHTSAVHQSSQFPFP
jgi:hypothetical protein